MFYLGVYDINFDRQYLFTAGKAGSEGFEIGRTSGKERVALHINFVCEKNSSEAQNTSKISIWNLNPSHVAMLSEKDCHVELRAGYGNRIAPIFKGIVSHASTSNDGADKKTDLEVTDSLVEVRDTYISISYQGTVSWKRIFDDTAARMGVAISYSHDATFADIHNGFSYVGMGRDILTKGCDCCKLEWSIQNGVLQIKKPGGVMNKEVYVLSAETGLLGIPVKVVIAQSELASSNTIGWDVTYFMNGAITIDSYVKLESKVITGYFRVHSITIEGDNVNGDWTCTARLLEVKA